MLFPLLVQAQYSVCGCESLVLDGYDYQRDGKSILNRSQVGHTVGLEVRLGAEDNTYFKLGGYYAWMHTEHTKSPWRNKVFQNC